MNIIISGSTRFSPEKSSYCSILARVDTPIIIKEREMRKPLLAIASIAVLSLGLSACGGDSADDIQKQPPAPVTHNPADDKKATADAPAATDHSKKDMTAPATPTAAE